MTAIVATLGAALVSRSVGGGRGTAAAVVDFALTAPSQALSVGRRRVLRPTITSITANERWLSWTEGQPTT